MAEKKRYELIKKICKECKGKGKINITVRAPRIVECKKCNGTGKIE